MSNTSATPVNFGWDFQRNAGLILLIDNMSDFVSIRMEGATEDIEITLLNGSKIYAQAKSVVKYDDFSNVKKNCKKALKTLSSANEKTDCKELIYVTNTPDPLSNQNLMGQFYGNRNVAYKDLAEKNQEFIDQILNENGSNNFDKEKFYIRVFPFHSNDLKERYSIILDTVKDYLGKIDSRLTIHTKNIVSIWQNELFENGTKSDTEINVTKRELQIPIIVAELNSNNIEEIEEKLDLGLDEYEIREIAFNYHDLINNSTDNYELITKVITLYKTFQRINRKTYKRECINVFISENWELFKTDFYIHSFSDFLQEALTKIVICKIINNRICIGRILEGGA